MGKQMVKRVNKNMIKPVNIKIIKIFIEDYPTMTNRDLYDFIKDYGETLFFINLANYLNEKDDFLWKNLYFDINYSYYCIKKYFEEH